MNCTRCNAELNPVSGINLRRRNDYPQYEDALIVDLDGGYGMYLDPMAVALRSDIYRMILCKDCAEFFRMENPWVDEHIKLVENGGMALVDG